MTDVQHKACKPELIGLVLLFLALMMSLCLNVVLCFRRRSYFCKGKDRCCYPHGYEGQDPSPDEGHYFHDLNHHEQQENPHNDHEQQENPIYGNICADRRGSASAEVCYEMMTMHRLKPSEPDLNYASLDLKLAKKRKKHRHQKDQTQGRGHRQDQLPVQLTPPMNSFLGVEGDMEPHLPSKDTSIMVSHSSIYLNSQQIAQETEMGREREISMERENTGAWKGEEMREDEGARDWEGELDGEERQDRRGVGNGTACAQLSELEASQSGADQ